MRLVVLIALALPVMASYDYVPEQFRAIFAEEVERAGMEQYAPVIAAQIQHESGWRPDVCSGVGACGLAQFLESTYNDVAEGACLRLGPKNPRCAIRAQLRYMADLLRFVYGSSGVTPPPSPVDAFQLAIASYNAGLSWVRRERIECYGERRCRSGVWLDNVERHCLRAERFCHETQAYVGRITNSALGAYLAVVH